MWLKQVFSSDIISFYDFFSACMYQNPHGYYENPNLRFGQDGDFFTAPTMGPIFADCIINYLNQLPIDDFTILEVGAGDGALAASLTKRLNNPYYILETSKTLIKRQQQKLGTKVVWVNEDFTTDKPLVIIANEVFDAMPVHWYQNINEVAHEVFVDITKQKLLYKALSSTSPLVKRLAKTNSILYSPDHSKLLKSLYAKSSNKIHCMIFDYGFLQKELHQGPGQQIRAYYQHQLVENYLSMPGKVDLTYFVNFSELMDLASQNQFKVLDFMYQGDFISQNLAIKKLTLEQNSNLKQLLLDPTLARNFKLLVLEK